MPCFATVFAVHDAGVRDAVFSDVLDGEYQSSVLHGNASSGTLKQEVPFGVLNLICDIDRCRPCLTIVGTFSHNKLCGVIHIHARMRTYPRTLITHAVCPSRYYPNGICLGIYKDRRVSYSVLCLRHIASLAKRQRKAHLFPSLTAIGTAAQTYIYMLLQVVAVVIANIVYAQQSTLVGSNQSRNTEGVRAIIACMTNTDTHIAFHRSRNCLDGKHLSVGLSTFYGSQKSRCKRCVRIHLYAHPEIVYSRIKLLLSFQHYGVLVRTSLIFLYRI